MNFEEKVWLAIKKIPKGKVSTYRELAKAVGKPKASRAVGNACNKNPFAPQTACHRVVKSSVEVGGFAQGTKKKILLLKKEGIEIKKGKILDFEKRLFRF